MAWSQWAYDIHTSQVTAGKGEIVVQMSGSFFNGGAKYKTIYDGYLLKTPKPGCIYIYPKSKLVENSSEEGNKFKIAVLPSFNAKEKINLAAGQYTVGIVDKSGKAQWHSVSVEA
ncbi:MAG: hypothetical protein PHE49_08415 [bacterium]|nr:hypothetical protein [bacterium]